MVINFDVSLKVKHNVIKKKALKQLVDINETIQISGADLRSIIKCIEFLEMYRCALKLINEN